MTTQYDLFASQSIATSTVKDVKPESSAMEPDKLSNETAQTESAAEEMVIEEAGEVVSALQAAREHSKKFLLPDVNVNEAFSALVVLRVEQYLADLEGVEGLPTYDMIVSAAERPLLQWAMDKAGGKQLAAAKILGINRNTLRKKLRMHGFLEGNFE